MKKIIFIFLFFISTGVFGQETLTFEQPDSSINWTENGKYWFTSGGTSLIKSNSNAFLGNGFLETKTSYYSKLNFETPINILSVQMYFDDNNSDWGTWAELKGFDSQGNNTHYVTINSDTGYDSYNLNWTNISSIGFTVNAGFDVINDSQGNYVSHTTKDTYVRLDNLVYQEQCQTDSSFLALTENAKYTAPDGQIYSESGLYYATITNGLACDSTIVIDLTIIKLEQTEVVDFEEVNNTTSWVEDGMNWEFITGTDKILKSNNQAFSGTGYGSSISGSNSKLVFESPLNLESIRIRHRPGFSVPQATLFAYDFLGIKIDSTEILTNNSYQLISLNWDNVSSISFDVPFDLYDDPMMMGNPTPTSVTLEFDELKYGISSPLGCQVPSNPQYSNVTSTSVQSYWMWENGKKYLVRHKPVSQPNWTYSDTLISNSDGIKTYTITGLEHDSTYQWQVQAICFDTLFSEFTIPFTWTTYCNTPSFNSPVSLNITDSSATPWWTDFGVSMDFNLRYREIGNTVWTTISVSDTSQIIISNLTASTDYEIQVEALCTESVSSGFSNIAFFSTSAAACQNTYSTIDTTISSFPYISPSGSYYYQAGTYAATINNAAGCDSVLTINVLQPTIGQLNIVDFEQANGTTSWTEDGLTWQFVGGSDETQMNLTNSFSGSGYGRTSSGSNSKLTFEKPLSLQSIRVKYNGGMVFMPATLLAYDSLNNTTASTSITPSSNFQLISLNWNEVSSISFSVPMDEMMDPMDPVVMVPMPQNLNFDELAYTQGLAPVCEVPTLAVPVYSSKSDTSALINWAASSNAQSYILTLTEMIPENGMTFTIPTPNSTQWNIVSLTPNIEYEVKLQAVCISGDTSDFSSPDLFVTLASFCQNTAFTLDTTINSFPFIAPDGSYYYQAGVYSATINNAAGCDSVITINVLLPTIDQPNIVDFEQANSTTSWTEDGLTWQFVGGSDQTQLNLYNAFSGSGFGRSSSGSNSILTFEEPLTLQSIRVKYYGGMLFMPATLYAYDSLNNVISSNTITPSGTYQLISLDWNEVSSISFNVPMDEMMDPMDPGISIPMPQDLYFDELAYTVGNSPAMCVFPSNPQYSNGTSTSIQPYWLWESGKSYLVRHQNISDGIWVYSDTLISNYDGIKTYTITGLQDSQTYRWQVQAICDGNAVSDFTAPFTWTTQCQTPNFNNSPTVLSITDSTAIPWWTDFGIPMDFNFRYRVSGNILWNDIIVSDTSLIVLSSLIPSTTYEIQVQAACTENVSSGYSNSSFFTTLTPQCQNTYATIDTTISSFPYIAPDGSNYYQAGAYTATINNAAGCDSVITINVLLPTIDQPNIVDFEQANNTISWTEDGLTWQFVGGSDQTQMNLYNAFSGSGFGKSSSGSNSKLTFEETLTLESIRVKYNGGMAPMPATLHVYDSLNTIITSISINPNGNYQLLTINENNVSSISFDVPMGEMMDPMDPAMMVPMPQDLYFDELAYSFGPQVFCEEPAQTQYSSGTSTSVQPYWWWEDGKQYLVRHKNVNDTEWIYSDTLLSNYDGIKNYTITGLQDSETYQWQVQAVCYDSVASEFSSPYTWTTGCNNPNFNGPPALDITDSSARLWYTNYGIPMTHNLRYRVVGDSVWTSIANVDTSEYTLTNLMPLTTYEAQVANNCSATISSEYSNSAFFTTLDTQCQTTYSTIDTTVTAWPYIAPDGGYYYSAGAYQVWITNTAGCDSMITINLIIDTHLIPEIEFSKESYCISSNGPEEASVSINCHGANVEWYSSNQAIFQNFINNDSSKTLTYGTTYFVRCIDSTGNSELYPISSNDKPFYGIPANPNFSFDGGNFSNEDQQITICPNSLIYIDASCGLGNITWLGSVPILDSLINTETPASYSLFCQGQGGCNSDTITASYSFKTLTYPNEIPTLISAPDTVSSCENYVNIQISGCTSQSYGGYVWQDGYNNGLLFQDVNGIAHSTVLIDSSERFYYYCVEDGCSSSLMDSVDIIMDNNYNKPPQPDPYTDSRNFCNLYGMVNTLSNACSLGNLIWISEIGNTNNYQNYSLSYNSPIYDGDTILLACNSNNCWSDTISYIVDYKVPPSPTINSSSTTFCEGSTAHFFTNSCPNPDFYPNWIVTNEINNSTSFYYTDTITVSLNSGSKVSLVCALNNTYNQCNSDTIVYIPNFTDNQLISNIQLSKDTLCHGETFNVNYTIGQTLPSGNILSVQLSDKFGSFESPLMIGQSDSANQLNITLTLPSDIIAGNQYKIRVVPSISPSGPGDFFCYESEAITILGQGAIRIWNPDQYNCQGSAITLDAVAEYFNNFIVNRNVVFYKDGVDISSSNFSNQNNKFQKIFGENSDAGIYSISMEYNGCILTSEPYELIYDFENNPPTFSDTTVTVTRGQPLNINTGCTSQWVMSGNEYTFYSIFPSFSNTAAGIFKDSTYFIACASGSCISDNRKVNVNVFDPPSAPELPQLSLSLDSLCQEDFYQIPITITATGCNGILEWSPDKSFGFIYETDSQAPYTTDTPFGNSTIYARCIENGIYSKGVGSISIHAYGTSSYQPPVISPATYSINSNEYTLETAQNAAIHLEVEIYTQNNSPSNMEKYCSNGIIKWFDSSYNLIGIGRGFDTTSTTSNFGLFMACEVGGKCLDNYKTINIVTKDSLFVVPGQRQYSICGSGSATLEANSCPGLFTRWFSDSTRTNLLHTGSSYLTPMYTNSGTQNIFDTVYVVCDNGISISATESIIIVTSPLPAIPSIQDSLAHCNVAVVFTPIINSCLSIEEPLWYMGDNNLFIMSDQLFRDTGSGNILNYNFSNIPRTYTVSCKNKVTTCESPQKQFTVSFDCTPPPPPIISIQNQTSSIGGEKGESNNDKGTLTANQFCVGDQVTLTAQNCENGTIFWSDGYVGSPRSYNVKQGYYNLLANCKNDNLVKSTVSNSLEFQSKPTPLFTMVDSVYNTSFVNLTADSVLFNKQFPVGTNLSYFSDQAFTNALPSPTNVTASGTYFARALAPNNCAYAEDVIVVIDKCGKIISLVSPLNNHNSGIVTASTRETITAQNKLLNSTRVNYQAEKSILLQQGFEAVPTAGGVILMEIGDCEN